MGDHVRNLLKALDTGIKLSSGLLASTSSANTLQTVDSVKSSLERTSESIRVAYRQALEACGTSFSQALLEEGVAKRLKELKNDLRDSIDDCSDFVESPESFDPESFACIQREAQKCCSGCISIFDTTRTDILELRRTVPPVDRDDRTTLTSMRAPVQSTTRKPLPSVLDSQVEPNPPIQNNALRRNTSPIKPVKPKGPWTIDGAIQYTPAQQTRHQSRDISPSSLPPISSTPSQTQHIAEEAVKSQVSTNEEFLERRRQSKIAFQTQLQKNPAPRPLSASGSDYLSAGARRISGTIDKNRVSEEFDGRPLRQSPRLESSPVAISPPDGRNYPMSPDSYDQMISRQRSLGQISQNARHSGTSSILAEASARQDIQRQGSTNSQESIFGLRAAQSPPLSPPVGGPSRSGSWNVEGLSATLKTPQFGENVHEGIEVAGGQYDYSSDKIFVPPNNQNNLGRAPPAVSTRPTHSPIPLNASFYLHRGWCEGAATSIRARKGDDWYKKVQKPLGTYNTTLAARCKDCSYEVGWIELQKDVKVDPTGIYKNSGIRWRHKFVTKSHLRAPSVTVGIYACVFCIDERKTVEDHDSTVFFSVQDLFCHLAKHPQPLPTIPGITVIYGQQPPTVLDFDLNFTTSIPLVPEFGMANIYQKVRTRPSGHAATDHRPKQLSKDVRDTGGLPVLQFAVGARIVGITFPERFKSEWYSGYHNGMKGRFPANTIVLEPPPEDDYLNSPKSTLVAIAKWDFKPKDAKGAYWLKFSKGEKITCIGYKALESWCWSGQNNKGKWGIFPSAFVEGLVEGDKLNVSMSSPPRSSTFSLPSFSIGRKSSRQDSGQERSMSIRSSSSGNSMGMVTEQPGLEIATSASPSQQVRTVGSWK